MKTSKYNIFVPFRDKYILYNTMCNSIADEELKEKIEAVVDKIKKDGKVMEEIERIKGHEWVKIVEGEERCRINLKPLTC